MADMHAHLFLEVLRAGIDAVRPAVEEGEAAVGEGEAAVGEEARPRSNALKAPSWALRRAPGGVVGATDILAEEEGQQEANESVVWRKKARGFPGLLSPDILVHS